MRIRDAGATDLAGLDRLESGSFAGDRLSPRSFRRLIASSSACVRVVGPSDDPAGYCIVLFRNRSRVARLYSIAVAGHRRGSGIGRALVADAERLARVRGCRILRLEVRPDNRAAVRLYRRLGYSQFAVYLGYYADEADALRLEKMLTRRAASRSAASSAPRIAHRASSPAPVTKV